MERDNFLSIGYFIMKKKNPQKSDDLKNKEAV